MSVPFTPEEPLAEVAYTYDGTLEGLLTAIFRAYEFHEVPRDIVPEDALRLRLGQALRPITTDEALAKRVKAGIKRAGGEAAFNAVLHASLSDDPKAGTIVYQFVRHAMAINRPHDCTGCRKRSQCNKNPNGTQGCTDKARNSVLSDITHPAVEPLLRLNRSVMNERELMLQFIRFEQLENGVWFAKCNPKAAVIPLIMGWFCARFNTQPFIIFDENHHMAGVYEGHGWYLVNTQEVALPPRASDEKLMQAAWKRFYDTIAIEARYNPELRRQHMPKRFWKNIVEVQESIPGADLAHEAPTG